MSEKQTKRGMTRRNFLRGSAAVGTGMLIVPSSYVFGGPSAPSNMITRAVIGTGGMGMGHVTKYPQTLAVCDVDKNHLENAKRNRHDPHSDAAPLACADRHRGRQGGLRYLFGKACDAYACGKQGSCGSR